MKSYVYISIISFRCSFLLLFIHIVDLGILTLSMKGLVKLKLYKYWLYDLWFILIIQYCSRFSYYIIMASGNSKVKLFVDKIQHPLPQSVWSVHKSSCPLTLWGAPSDAVNSDSSPPRFTGNKCSSTSTFDDSFLIAN